MWWAQGFGDHLKFFKLFKMESSLYGMMGLEQALKLL
jgi:hypothetical protein